MSFRLLTLNIQNGQPWDPLDPDRPEVDIASVADFLRGQEADIFCLQEVERGYDGGSQVEPPPNYNALRAMMSGYDSVFSYPLKNDCEIPFGLGLAIFSKTPLENFERVDLPAAPIEFEFAGKKRCASSRLLLSAATNIGGRRLHILNAHLQAFFMVGSSSDEHPAQRDQVESRLRELSGPSVLAGDMNSTPEEGLVSQFARAGFSTVQNSVPTWKRRPYVVDHIFHNNGLRLLRQSVLSTSVSDHDAVEAEFDFL
ncbi:MAG: endonuclease/exonuclease/phosphatase family protein [Verrucomicrobiota bacterium]